MPKPTPQKSQAKIGFVSLGCPKALVDSERIITRLRAEGYELSASYQGADAVVVNTCGFLNSAKEESLAAIGEALAENGKVIVTGCLGVEEDRIRAAHPGVLAQGGDPAGRWAQNLDRPGLGEGLADALDLRLHRVAGQAAPDHDHEAFVARHARAPEGQVLDLEGDDVSLAKGRAHARGP